MFWAGSRVVSRTADVSGALAAPGFETAAGRLAQAGVARIRLTPASLRTMVDNPFDRRYQALPGYPILGAHVPIGLTVDSQP